MSREVMNKIAVRARSMILDNVQKGIDITGKRYEYSTKPFARPYDSRIKGAKGYVAEGRLTMFRTKADKLWMVVNKGYRDYRLMKGQSPDSDFLTVTGAMLRNLQITDISDTDATLGFTDGVQLKKALWFNVMGAGKSKRLWRFLGLRKEQEEELAKYAATLLTNQYLEDMLKSRL